MDLVLFYLVYYLLLTPFYTRLFVEGEYGQLTKLYSYSAFFIVFLTFGTETSFFRYIKKYDLKTVFSNAFIFILVTSALFIGAIFSFESNILSVINIDSNPIIIYLVAGIVLTDVITSLPFASLRYREKAKLFSLFKISSVVLNILFNLFFYFFLPKLAANGYCTSIYSESFGYGYAFLSNFLSNFLILLFLIPQFHIKFNLIRWPILGVIFIYSYPIVLSGLAGMINDVGDKIFLDYFISDSHASNYAIGIYGANYKIATLMIIFIQMYKYAAEPFFFKISGDTDHKSVYAQATKIFIYFGVFIYVFIIGYIDIFKYFIDIKYRVGLKIVPLVLLANLFFGIFYNLAIWYKITDKTKFGTYLTIVGATVTLVLNALLIPIYGYMGSAVATLACFVSMAVLNYFLGLRNYKIPYDLKNILPVFIFGITISILFWWLRSSDILYSLLFGTSIIFAYLLFIIFYDKSVYNYLKLLWLKLKL